MRRALVVAAALLLTGCGAGQPASRPAAEPTVPNVVPALSSSERTLDVQGLARDALRPRELATLLKEAGFLGGTEREFTGRSTRFEHVVVRRLRFGSTAGAERYLGWLRTHAGDILGRTRPERPLAVGSSPLLVSLAPCGVCKKEVPTYLAAWRDGAVVLSLLGSGPGVDRTRFARLADEVDARMRA